MDNRTLTPHGTGSPIPTDELESVFEHVANPVVHVDNAGHILAANPSATEWLGTTHDEMIGQPLDRWITSDALEQLVESVTGAEAGPVAVPLQVSDSDHETRGAWARPACDGRAIRILLATEPDPVRTQGQAALGGLGAEVGHELNNHLLVLGGYAQLLPMHLENQEWGKAKSDAAMILAEVERSRHLTEGLIQIAPRSDALPLCEIVECVRSTVAFLQPLNRFDGIEIRQEDHCGRSFAGVARGVVHQWLLNVLCTCADALAGEPEPELVVRTSPTPDWAAQITIERSMNTGNILPDPLRESATRLLVGRAGLRWTCRSADQGLRATRNDLYLPFPDPGTADLLRAGFPASR